ALRARHVAPPRDARALHVGLRGRGDAPLRPRVDRAVHQETVLDGQPDDQDARSVDTGAQLGTWNLEFIWWSASLFHLRSRGIGRATADAPKRRWGEGGQANVGGAGKKSRHELSSSDRHQREVPTV